MALSALAQPEQTGLPGDPSYQGFSEGFNQAPLLVSLIPDRPAPQEAGTSVKWTALGQDPDGDPILYQFRLRGPSTGGVWQPVTGWSRDGTWEWRVSASDVGENQVGVWIRDGLHSDESGFDDQRTTDYQIVQAQPAVVAAQPEAAPNQPPAILEFGPDRGSPQEAGTTITWTATASDPDGDPILYRFLLNGAPVTDWQPEPQWTWSAEQPGESQITVQVRDGKHSEVDDTRSASFMIASPNQPPAISDLSADRASPQEAGTTITWTATASDPDGDPILYRFLLNGAPATDWQPEPQWTWSADQPGESQITVQVRDDMHPGPEGEMGNMSAMFTIVAPAPGNVTPPVTENITLPVEAENVTLIPENVTAPAVPAVENQTPVLNALIPNLPSPQAPGAAVVWSANATDADGDQILYRFFLSGPATGGSLQPMTDWVSASTWTWNTAAGDAGENQVRVAVRDGRHAAEDGYDAEQTVYFIIARPTRNITGSAFHDLNGNGRKDSGEALSGWMIQLSRDGSEVATITDDQGSYRFEGLEPGSYVVSEVLPSGWEAISPEGGSYSLELSETDAVDRDFSNRLTSYSISGMKFNDLNANGVNDGEPGIAGWSIQLSRDGGVVNATTTGQDGSYRFEGLAPGTYTVAEVEQSGWIRTAPKGGSYTVELKDSDVTGRDFGNRGSWSIAGSVFQDVNGDGSRGEDEPGIAGWSIQLSRDGGVVNATTTGQDGSYRFEGLAPGTYTVSEVLQEGFSQTVPQGPYTVELKDADVTGRDFGNRGNLTITGVKFYDANGNGLQEEDEPGIPGGSVSLIRDGAVLATTTTDEDGAYSFNNVLPGTYTISDPLPGGLVLTTSSTVVVTVKTSLVVKANFGVAGQYSISGVKYNDLNGNGARDAGEPGIAGWEMLLTGNLWFGKPIHARTAITASDGSYKFERLLPGTYKVSETSRTGWTQTAPSGGSYTVTFPFGSAPSESKNNDFGNRVPGQSISGVKYNDLNGNGARDSGEPGLAGWTINLEQPAGTVIQTKTTASDGSYIFTGLADGTYVVSEVLQTGWTQKAPAGGTYTVTLSPSSPSAIGKDFGNWIPGPTNPTLTSDKSSPQRAGTPIVWTAGATDPDGDPLQYRFFVRGPTPSHTVRADTGYSPSNTWTWSTIGYAPGTYSVEVWIRDGEHAGPGSYDVKKAVSFTLTSPNLPPVVSVLFADRPAPQVAGSWVKWTAIGFDPEGDPLQYRFFLRGPSTGGFWVDQTGWGKNNRWIWRTGPMDVGYSEVLVAVRDGKHSGPAGADDYSISGYYIINLNQPPVITGLGSSAPSPQPIGALVRWQATALDAEHNPVFYRYLLRGPSTGGLWRVVRDWSTDPSWTWATTLADAGTSEIRVHVRDGFHSGPAGWDDDVGALFTVLGPNQPPRLISLQPDRPSPQEAGAAVRWTARASDPERDPILYRFWLKGPSTGDAWKVVQDWSTKSQWVWTSSPADSGAYTVYVYARDGRHSGAGGYDSAIGAAYLLLKSSNQPPKIVSLQPDRPSPQEAGAAVRWTARASDPERDPILYRFWLKGPSTGDAWKVVQDWSTKSQWTWASAPSDVGSYGVYVYARDGKHAGPGGYDSAAGQTYALQAPKADRLLSQSGASGSMPSLEYTGDGYLLAYQSWDPATGDDILLQKFDPDWNALKSSWVSKSRANESSPSLASAGGYHYVAYVSMEKGNRDIFLKKYDGNLRLVDSMQLTSSPTEQDSPSLIAVGDEFYLAYQTWDTGSESGGDIAITRYDRNWNPVASALLTDDGFYQDRPSLAFSSKSPYVAYVSRETGNLDVFVKRLDQGLKVLETRRMTSDRSDQDYPDLGWHNGQFILLYASKKAGNYDIVLDRYSDDWRPVDSMVAVAGTGDQTEPSLTYSTAARAYWLAYTSRGAEEKYSARVYLRSLQLPGPS